MPNNNEETVKCIGSCERTLPITHLNRCVFCDNYICEDFMCSVSQGSEFYSCIECPPRPLMENTGEPYGNLSE